MTTIAASKKALETINAIKNELKARGVKASNITILEYVVSKATVDDVYAALKTEKSPEAPTA